MNDRQRDLVSQMFTAICTGDMASFKTCFAPGAVVWHNDTETESDIDSSAVALGGLHSASHRLEYENQRINAVDSVFYVEHIFTAALKNGKSLRLPAMMRIDVNAEGLIERINEYYDSRATDVLTED